MSELLWYVYKDISFEDATRNQASGITIKQKKNHQKQSFGVSKLVQNFHVLQMISEAKNVILCHFQATIQSEAIDDQIKNYDVCWQVLWER